MATTAISLWRKETDLKRIIPILMLMSALALCAQSAPLSMDEARDLALSNNPDYQASLSGLEAAKWDKMNALSGFMPSLSLDGTWLYMDPAQTVATGAGSITLNHDFRTFGFSLSQPIFLGGKLWQAYQMARVGVDMAETSLASKRLEVISGVNDRYLAVLQAQSLRQITDLDQQSAEKNYEIAQIKYDNGLLSSADYLRFKSRLASKEVSSLQAQTAMQMAQMSLRDYLLLDYLPLVQELPSLDDDAILLALDSYDAEASRNLSALALQRGREENYSLRLLDKSVELSRRSISINKGSFLPTLMLVANRSYEENGIDRYQFDHSDQIMLTASLPILPQLGNYAKLRKAKASYRQATLNARTAEAGILMGTEAAVLNMVSAAKQVRASRLALSYTEQSYDQMQERFRVNLISSTELLDAELMLSSARVAYMNSEFAYYKARVELQRLLGMEDPTALNEMIISGVKK